MKIELEMTDDQFADMQMDFADIALKEISEGKITYELPTTDVPVVEPAKE